MQDQLKKITGLMLKNWGFVAALLLLLFLLTRNPFSERTLIPNFEPFPDPLYYLVPPRCWLQGEGWWMCRDGLNGIPTVVPPGYSLVILPFLLIKNDPRMFYFANVSLSLISLTLFYLISKRLFKNNLISALLLLFYTTNYFTYWLPTLAMAENLILPLFLAAVYLFLPPPTIRKQAMIILLSLGIFFSKSSFVPLGVTFLGFVFIQLLNNPKVRLFLKKNWLLSFILLVSIVVTLSRTHKFQWVIYQNLLSMGRHDNPWFSFSFMKKHLPLYWGYFLGSRTRFLWDTTPLISKWIAFPSLLGLFLALLKKKARFFSALLILSLTTQVVFLSSFYSIDARYIFIAIPTLLFGFGFTLMFLSKLFKKKRSQYLFFLFLLIIFSFYSFHNAIRIKKQISLNIKYAEQPWWYLSIKEMNGFFVELEPSSAQPLLISLHPPYLVDFFSNQTYRLLPMAMAQDFRNVRKEVWGESQDLSFLELYHQKLIEGRDLYVTNYGTGAAGEFSENFAAIEKEFELENVSQGCHQLCNIYRVVERN